MIFYLFVNLNWDLKDTQGSGIVLFSTLRPPGHAGSLNSFCMSKIYIWPYQYAFFRLRVSREALNE